jgi:protein O-GlcNAc transferase
MQNAQTLYQQAYQLHIKGQFAAAEQLYLAVIGLQSQHADALHMLGLIYYQTQRPQLAADYLAKAIQHSPRNLDYLNNYGLALQANQQFDAALKHFQQAILLQPKDLNVQLNLANTLLELARFDEAAEYYRRILKASQREDIRGALVHCFSMSGNAAHQAGQFSKAETAFKEAVNLSPRDAALHYNLANAARELGQLPLAEKHYRLAIQYAPDDADAYNNLGNVQREAGQLDLAVASYEQALARNPKLYHAKVHLVHQRQHMCDWRDLAESVAEIRHWVQHIPEAQVSPFAFLAMPGTTMQEQKQCADQWVKHRYAALFEQAETLNFNHAAHTDFSGSPEESKRKIRIGYLSADFRLHPLAFLISELIELHDRSRFEIVAFSFGVNDQTPARKRLEQAFDQFHDIRNLSESVAAAKIHACGIDTLVDLTGFTQTSRSGIAALRPAPITVNWLGFPGTMGSYTHQGTTRALFDYIITDAFISPPGSATAYAEKIAALPLVYQPNDRLRPVGKLPSREACGLPEGQFVFCSFNQTYKITPEIFAIWMRLLQTQPDSVLWLMECNPWAKQNLQREAEQAGVDKSRLIFAPRVPIDEHLARHAYADLFLDTLPYNAHTTCSDALWMGLPVLTCAGDTFAARVAGSLLTAAGLPELVCHDLATYEAQALHYATNPQALADIKARLIGAKTEGPLFDTAAFARALEALYLKMLDQLKTENSLILQ